MKLISPTDRPPLSDEAKIILRHLVKSPAQPETSYEYPAVLAEIVPDALAREAALAELERHTFVERAIFPESVPPAIMSCRLTHEGKRFATNGGLDD